MAGTGTPTGSLSASTLTGGAGRADRVGFGGRAVLGSVGGGDLGFMRGRNGIGEGRKKGVGSRSQLRVVKDVATAPRDYRKRAEEERIFLYKLVVQKVVSPTSQITSHRAPSNADLRRPPHPKKNLP